MARKPGGSLSCGFLLSVKTGEMLVPLDSRVLLERNSHLLVVRWAFCLNYCLVVMNLIPASPFDGSRMVHGGFAPILDV